MLFNSGEETYPQALRDTLKKNLERWQKPENLLPTWDKRTEQMATLLQEIPGEIKRVVDYGCGNMALESFLPAHIKYIPVDVVKRRRDTRVMDLNTVIRPPVADVAFFSGSLEYVVDLEKTVTAIARKSRYVLCSYLPHPGKYSLLERQEQGMMNHLSIAEFMLTIERTGLLPLQMNQFRVQRIFLFRRQGAIAPS